MKFKSKLVAGALGLAFLANTSIAFAETSTTTTNVSGLVSQIQALMLQVKTLQAQLETALKQKYATTTGATGPAFWRELRRGMDGDDVKDLQRLLATDPEIYPEGLITGHFGEKTEKALTRFQDKSGIEREGKAGPKTLERIREIIKDGAGKSGKIPPGLLRAPGILKKLDGEFGSSTRDITAPAFVNPPSTNVVGSTTASIVISTNEHTRATIIFGSSTTLAESVSKYVSYGTPSLNHTFNLSGLTTNTVYYWMVWARDIAGNVATTSINSFTTTN